MVAGKKLILLFFLSVCVFAVKAQDSTKAGRDVVQLTGLIVEGDSMYGVPYVNVTIKNSNRGTVSNVMGYFSMPVYEADTVEFEMIGFRKEVYPISTEVEGNISIIVHLVPDTAVFAVIEIYPYPNLESFTEAFLTAELYKQDVENMKKNLNERLMRRILYYSDMDANLNHRYFSEQYVVQQETQCMYPTIPLLDPFAWVRFFKDIKKYKKNKKEGKYDYLEDE